MTLYGNSVRYETAPDAGWVFAACQATAEPGREHAVNRKAALCGIPRDQVTVYRHHFDGRKPNACADCRAAASDAPDPTRVRHRLRVGIETAAPGRLLDALDFGLRQGAEVRMWTGPAYRIVHEHADTVRLADCRAYAEDLALRGGTLTLAKVNYLGREFVVFLPMDGPPSITYTPRAARGL
ncbi:hypothetical protein [Yinghuangia sp. YIM S10712]|uniref:hypothetical protein n=1 Tax=Yinghuangia sp. YIM S10712 TaxID=3436930 RepID=UPI003F52E38D